MVNKLHISLVVLLALPLLFGGCRKKEEPVAENGTPVFAIDGMIDNTHREYTGGRNNFYMYTDYRSSSGEPYEFIGDMKQTCTDCKESLRIIIKNYQGGVGSVDPNQAFHTGEYFYVPGAGSQFNKSLKVTLDAKPSGNGTVSHFWDFGDGTTSTLANPIKTYPANHTFTITYTASYSNGCSSSVSIPVGIKAYAAPPPNVSFTSNLVDTNGGSNLFSFNANVSDTGGTSEYYWNFGTDTGYVSGNPVQHEYFVSGVYTVSLYFVKNNTDTVVSRQNLSVQNTSTCVANFNMSKQANSDAHNYSGIIVEWTDASGNKYSSAQAEQDEKSNFFIDASSPYIDNERAQKTRALDVRFNCKLSNGTTIIELRNMEGHIAVGHP